MLLMHALLLVTDVHAGIFISEPKWVVHMGGLLALMNVISVIYLLRWKKWAFFTFCLSTGVTVVVGIILGKYIYLLSPVGLLILYILLRPEWSRLK